jgi:type I restriction enzyme S subunit
MNAERLLGHYERIADAPDAVPRLRRFVLNLAVCGKLVSQDPNDEPASELLKRIAVEKARLVKTGAIGREKPPPPVASDETPFELPEGWVWARLGSLSQLVTSGSRDWAKHYSNEGAIFVRMGNLSKGHYRLRLGHIQRVKPPADGEGTRTRLEAGDILISITGDVGMLGLIPEGFGEAYINQHTAMVRPILEMKGRYLPELFRSPFAQDQFNEPQRGIKNSFRLTDVTQFVVPLPPLAEQHRIVAKVDELMALCDRLEATRADREATRDRFTSACLVRLDVRDPDTFRDDARFALDTLTALTARADQINQLRQAILNLAGSGMLVQQDPNDEPALESFKKIAAEKARLMDAAGVRRPRPTSPASVDDVPFALPRGWYPVRLGAVIDLLSGQHLLPSEYSEDAASGVPYITGPSDFADGGLRISRYALIRKAVAQRGQLLLTVKGSGVGKTTICNLPEVAISRQLMALIPIQWDVGFLTLVTHRLAERLQEQARSLIPGIGREDVEEFAFALPPLAEQHRIVAKVDELMALCDRLEASLTAAADTRRCLLDALLAEALKPNEEQELEAAE